ncbi:MAG: hypothetical protein NXI27_14255 [Alphaproteobacteria bacterium]|nr:hypothetical protein [Alphaproteobacteria bacterium]
MKDPEFAGVKPMLHKLAHYCASVSQFIKDADWGLVTGSGQKLQERHLPSTAMMPAFTARYGAAVEVGIIEKFRIWHADQACQQARYRQFDCLGPLQGRLNTLVASTECLPRPTHDAHALGRRAAKLTVVRVFSRFTF